MSVDRLPQLRAARVAAAPPAARAAPAPALSSEERWLGSYLDAADQLRQANLHLLAEIDAYSSKASAFLYDIQLYDSVQEQEDAVWREDQRLRDLLLEARQAISRLPALPSAAPVLAPARSCCQLLRDQVSRAELAMLAAEQEVDGGLRLRRQRIVAVMQPAVLAGRPQAPTDPQKELRTWSWTALP